jgi:hypothetical protein
MHEIRGLPEVNIMSRFRNALSFYRREEKEELAERKQEWQYWSQLGRAASDARLERAREKIKEYERRCA